MGSLLLGLSLASLFFLHATASVYDLPLDCAGRKPSDDRKCAEPLKDPVTSVIPGEFYVARLPCLGCPTVESLNSKKEGGLMDNDLFFNISLSHDSRTLYLNDVPFFPSFSTVPTPTKIAAAQIAHSFSRSDLDTSIKCAIDICANKACSCLYSTKPDDHDFYFGKVNLDYDHYSHWIESETEKENWEITFDVVGGWDYLAGDKVWKANATEQQMLRIVVEGVEVDEDVGNMAGGGSLFEEPSTLENVYEYKIMRVDLTKRTYTFPATDRARLGFWDSIRRFFGTDIIRSDGHIVFLQEEWGSYGKHGSLRNHLGVFIHEMEWALAFTIIGYTIAGILLVAFACKLFLVLKQQRQLARWEGIDTVWANMRREPERVDEEENTLLSREDRYRDSDGEGSYRDDFDESDEYGHGEGSGGLPRYTDEVRHKPLPSKPLPEKPLPAVPLIDT